MPVGQYSTDGLSAEQVLASRAKYGSNKLHFKKENRFWHALKSLVREPMVILLLSASLIYFITGNTGDGIFLSSAILLVSAISLYQDSRSRQALEELKDFTQPKCKVIRQGREMEIRGDDLVVGDSMMVDEGSLVSADGKIFHCNDFSVNESLLTGESVPVTKDTVNDSMIYRGTNVASGLAIARVTAVGNETRLGKIGESLKRIKEEKTPLELQIGNFVRKMVMAGAVVFLIVWAINFFRSFGFLESLLKALTLAMSILPEEIPVAFTTFMALGAWRLMKMGVVVKQMKTVEALGSATVICTDKTGTLTENRMSLAKLFVWPGERMVVAESPFDDDARVLVRAAMWASEPIPFDPMEIALHRAYASFMGEDERLEYRMIHEYPLSGKPPMMTHLFENAEGRRIISAKGAPEALIQVSNLAADEKSKISDAVKLLASEGYRVLGVGVAEFNAAEFPVIQQEFHFAFRGLVAFHDPPKKNIPSVLQGFYQAGIVVKIITGDYPLTTMAIAREVGFKVDHPSMNGEDLMKLSDDEFNRMVKKTNVFTRMFPEAKLRIINALKSQHEIVAMTGDGVNDGPALKAAHIGIAMGKRGSEIAKQAASLVLLEDDLSRMLDAVAMGRKIYYNLKKAVRYIISIHIPIILTVFAPLAFGWIYPNIFSPIHIIFLELIMGPTCSIIYENEPIEQNAMAQKPRLFTNTFFNWKELATSTIQGLVIAAGALVTYQHAIANGLNESETRTMVFTVLICANIWLTLVNRSFYYSIVTTLRYPNRMVLVIIAITVSITALLLFVRPLIQFFEFSPLSRTNLLFCATIGFSSVLWFEIVKAFKRWTEG